MSDKTARPSACVIVLSTSDRQVLETWVRCGSTPQKTVLRSLIVLLAADGCTNASIAIELDVHPDTVRKWRSRFHHHGIDALADAPRSGRPPIYTPADIAAVKAWACQIPADHDIPIARWSTPELAAQLARDGMTVSVSTVRRWLDEDALKPWQHRSWIAARDPNFEMRASVVLDLYARRYAGKPLGSNEFVISADEKPSIQARDRCHRTTAAAPGRPMRVSHDYRRRGALTYLAAYDVHTARVFGRCEQSTGITEFTALVDQVMTSEPYASADRVFWVVDNGSSHRGQASIDRLTARYPNAVMVHTPVHASWLNQVEIYFSIVQRKVLTPNDFPDLTSVENRLHTFAERYNRTAEPFAWKYTRRDLHRQLKLIDQSSEAA
ncbi:IS630 family transposase [Williamsia sp. 1135]|uniref:IS630 family transposase n=1 Tax=Williamsia sp. 1135 TaxID=1889262 RepID=UPI000A112811|nr:IS630 family transposase [Williamsia sp. 1135]ORM27668.1 IS630 family transposase [Williamsia sp. 1135]ORM31907.1 IS630 family transposase [Williamsia sp. 1135]ORM33445.1 IS630 family transposase [Williamsia sp. 1135]ORM35715.1 IS630 family transposase [Williamsia sp. 1135]ORM36858.1 IS630 family transposase [Williamsia sp. 1135]